MPISKCTVLVIGWQSVYEHKNSFISSVVIQKIWLLLNKIFSIPFQSTPSIPLQSSIYTMPVHLVPSYLKMIQLNTWAKISSVVVQNAKPPYFVTVTLFKVMFLKTIFHFSKQPPPTEVVTYWHFNWVVSVFVTKIGVATQPRYFFF